MALTTVDSGLLGTQAQYTGFKNRILNGGMVIDQRNAGASVTAATSGGQYTVDRWNIYTSVGSKLSFQQNAGSVTPPTGFTNYLGITSLSSYSVSATDEFLIRQPIEGYNVADFGFGAAGASTVTLSFWVRSSLTGSFGAALQNSSSNRSYPFSYTISSANTWEQKTVTIAGDTTGTWNKTNGSGLYVSFGLGVGSTYGSGTAGAWAGTTADVPTGSVSVVGTNGATFYITGVQLEKGSTATSFDYRPYGTELALCQRYYWRNSGTGATTYHRFCSGSATATTNVQAVIQSPVQMRVGPTSIDYSANLGVFDGASVTTVTAVAFDVSAPLMTSINLTAAGLTQFRPYQFIANNTASAYFGLSAEL